MAATKTRSSSRKPKFEKPRGGWKTREQWLHHAAELIRPLIEAQGVTIPKVRLSVGWPKGSRGGGSVHAIGQCWCSSVSADETHEIFVSPELDDPARVLDVLAHELVHAACGIPEGHGAEFKRVATGIGLTGRMTATVAGPEFESFAKGAAKTLGKLPHAALGTRGATSGSPKAKGPQGPEGEPGDGADTPKQKGRLVKVECPNEDCGMVARVTRKWIAEPGLPTCACGTKWVVAEGQEAGA